jgi:cytochrome b6-f complex iron-sulfur subunit
MGAERDDRAGRDGGAGAAPAGRAGTLLLVGRPGLQAADFKRLRGLVAELPVELRWARRGERLLLLLDGVRPDDAAVARLAQDSAFEYALRDPSPAEVERLVSRRDLLEVALVTTGALAAACSLAALALFLSPPGRERQPGGDVAVAHVDRLPPGGSQGRVVDGEDWIIVRRDETHFHALSATCTHSMLCLVEWDARRHQLVCPCHRGVFDLQGNVVSGPPPRPLARREVVVRDGVVWM